MRRMAPLSCPKADEEIPALNAVICTVMVLNSVVERNGNRILEELGLTMPQWLALGAIAHSGAEGLPHSALGERLMLSKAPITGIVDRLVRSGFVTRHVDARDRRISRIVATPEGIAEWWSVKDALRARTEEICGDCLSEEEKETLLTLLGRLLERFSDQASQSHEESAAHGP
jgi:MarR family 2-MHQ and catechol resistance regulon transcriptional repressor